MKGQCIMLNIKPNLGAQLPSEDELNTIITDAVQKATASSKEIPVDAANMVELAKLSTPAVAENGASKSALSLAIAKVTSDEEVAALMTAHKEGKIIIGSLDRSHIFDAGTLMTLNRMRLSMRETGLTSLFNELTVKIQLIPHGVENEPEDYLYMAALAVEMSYRRKADILGAN
jgi:hypothetical protein